ncbi:hypothetical protein EIP91_001209 [Steccherinum ochraceum]|uniref:Uncharacterized protein n=1 Tax=Steccherinum ochraceum TaxID=92696 RepID=A0A4R0RQ79_9APHY|nr:hypothetical protein EIP91_001209 [Steccherinum ochraceum]
MPPPNKAPAVNKAAISEPMVLQPTVTKKDGGVALKDPSVLEAMHPSSASIASQERKTSKAPQLVPTTQTFLTREIHSSKVDKSSAVSVRSKAPSTATFPSSTGISATTPVPRTHGQMPPPLPPKDNIRPRLQSKASTHRQAKPDDAKSLLTNRPPDDGRGSRSPPPPPYSVYSHPGTSTPTVHLGGVTVQCLEAAKAYMNLVRACMEAPSSNVKSLVEIFQGTMDKIVKDLEEQVPEELLGSADYTHSKASFDLTKQILHVTNPDLSTRGTQPVMAAMEEVWANFVSLLITVEQEAQYMDVDPAERAREVQEFAGFLGASDSSSSLKSGKRSLTDYFTTFSGSLNKVTAKFRKLQSSGASLFHPSPSSSSSSIAASSIRTRNSPMPSEPAQHRFGLRESHIFCAATAQLAASIPQYERPGAPTLTLQLKWYIPLSDNEAIYTDVAVTSAEGNTIKKRVLAACSFEYLVRHILQNLDKAECAGTIDAFFMNFRSYSPPLSLFELLKKWFTTPSQSLKAYVPNSADQIACRRFVKMQIIKFVTRWLELHWLEGEDHTVRDALVNFTYTTVANDSDLLVDMAEVLAVSLCRISATRITRHPPKFQARINKCEQDQQTHSPTTFTAGLGKLNDWVLLKKDFKIMNILHFSQPGGVEELARGLTLAESRYFRAILPQSIVGWRNTEDIKELKPWDSFINTFTFLVADAIIGQPNAQDRIQAFELLVDVAVACKSLRNFSSARNIILSLKIMAVERLKVEEQISAYHLERFKQLDKFFRDKTGYTEEMVQTRPAVPLPNMMKYAVRRSHEEAASSAGEDAAKIKKFGYIDMLYLEKVSRSVRALENVYGEYSIPCQQAVLAWIEANRAPYVNKSYDQNAACMLKRVPKPEKL